MESQIRSKIKEFNLCNIPNYSLGVGQPILPNNKQHNRASDGGTQANLEKGLQQENDRE